MNNNKEMDEFREIKSLLSAFKKAEEIEPSSNFQSRVMQEIASIEHRAKSIEQVTPLRSTLNALRSSLRYAPAWAISAGIHIVLFAILALVFVSSTDREVQHNYVVKFIPPESRREILTTSGMPGLSNQQIPPERIVERPIDVEPPPVDFPTPPETVKVNPQDYTPPPSYWSSKLPPLVKLGDRREKGFLAHITANRTGVNRKQLLSHYGGDSATEHAVAGGLNWLKQTQETDGSWRPEKYGGRPDYQVGLSALVLLTFLGDGSSSQNGTYKMTVNRGIKFLLSQQQTSGLYGPTHLKGNPVNYMYNHGIATAAVLEDYCLTKDKTEEESARQAVNFILTAQNREGGWGYQSQSGGNDTSVTVWQVMALRIARALEIRGVAESLKKASVWLASVTNKDGQVGYRKLNSSPNGTYALTAAGMFTQLYLGWDKDDALIEKQSKILISQLPKMKTEELDNDFYYWYFGTLALHQKGGKDWPTWNKHLKETLVKSQESGTSSQSGSWEPADKWSAYGGRLYTTAMATLTLQTYYRYARQENS